MRGNEIRAKSGRAQVGRALMLELIAPCTTQPFVIFSLTNHWPH